MIEKLELEKEVGKPIPPNENWKRRDSNRPFLNELKKTL
jgi:hypothetical protein